jgi:hypothetical protein
MKVIEKFKTYMKTAIFQDSEDKLQLEHNYINQMSKKKLQMNPPYNHETIDNKFADNTQMYKSFQRRKRNAEIVCPYSSDCQKDLSSLEPAIRERLQTSDFWIYANDTVNNHALAFLNIGSIEKRLTYSTELLIPLTSLSGDMKQVGLKIFRLIFKICLDRERPSLPYFKLRKLIEILMNNSAEVKDECFLQLIKQIRTNPFLTTNFNEWKLLAVIASLVSPSEYFIYYFLNYMYHVFTKTTNDEVRQWAMFVLMRTVNTNKTTERMVLPAPEEILKIEDRRKIAFEVFFFNGSSEVYFVESYWTLEDLKNQIIDKYELDSNMASYFGLYEVCKKPGVSEETYVDDRVKVLDVMSSWSNEVQFLHHKNNGAPFNIKFKLYFTRRFEFKTATIQHEVINFYECCRAFDKNRYNIDYETFRRLLALKLRVEFGVCNKERLCHVHLNFKHVAPKLNREIITPQMYNKIINEVSTEYSAISMSTFDCMMEFLKICRAFELYACDLFPVKFVQSSQEEKESEFELPDNVIIGIKDEAIMILDQNFGKLLEFKYNEIMKWGFNIKLFILLLADCDKGKPLKLNFKTKIGSNICYALNSLVEIKQGKIPKPNTLNLNENVTREVLFDKFFKKMSSFKSRSLFFK